MNRIVIHWTAGGPTANATDKRHYHFIVQGDGTVVVGNHSPAANKLIANPQDGNSYAAHTRGLNTGSIGVAFAAMRGAVERPFSPGPSPITDAQVRAMASLVAKLCREYRIPVQRDTVLTHAEVQPTLKIAQRGKWDVTWLPGMGSAGNPVAVGDNLRKHILVAMRQDAPAARPAAQKLGSVGFFARLLAWLGGRK
jgi:hypothetical protein